MNREKWINGVKVGVMFGNCNKNFFEVGRCIFGLHEFLHILNRFIMSLILATVVAITGGGSSDQEFSPGVKRAINSDLFNAFPPESLDPIDADTAAIIHVPINTGATYQVVQRWTLSMTLNQLITAINAVESAGGGGTTLDTLLSALNIDDTSTSVLPFVDGSGDGTTITIGSAIQSFLASHPTTYVLPYFDGSGLPTYLSTSAFGRNILNAANVSDMRGACGISTHTGNALTLGVSGTLSISQISASAIIIPICTAGNSRLAVADHFTYSIVANTSFVATARKADESTETGDTGTYSFVILSF